MSSQRCQHLPGPTKILDPGQFPSLRHRLRSLRLRLLGGRRNCLRRLLHGCLANKPQTRKRDYIISRSVDVIQNLVSLPAVFYASMHGKAKLQHFHISLEVPALWQYQASLRFGIVLRSCRSKQTQCSSDGVCNRSIASLKLWCVAVASGIIHTDQYEMNANMSLLISPLKTIACET